MLNIIQILGTTSIPAAFDIVNSNFTETSDAVNKFLEIYDTNSGNIDLSINTIGLVKAKKVQIPLGNDGLFVGNSSMTDNSVTTKTLVANNIVDDISSLQTKTFAVNATGVNKVSISATTRTLVLDPTASNLTFDISSPVSDQMVDLFVINMSSTSDTCGMNITANFIDQSSMTKINIPFKKNLHLRYLNNVATSTAGWYLVAHNGCTII